MSRRVAVVAASLGALLFSACGPDSNIWVVNNSDQYMYLYVPMTDGAWQKLTEMPPRSRGQQNFVVSAGKCLPDAFIADKNGNVLKRIEKLCWHDTVAFP